MHCILKHFLPELSARPNGIKKSDGNIVKIFSTLRRLSNTRSETLSHGDR